MTALPVTSDEALAPLGCRPAVLALVGDRFHNMDYIRLHLKRLFGELSLPFEYTANYEWFRSRAGTESALSRRRLLCIFRDGIIFPGGYVRPDSYSHYSKNLMADPPDGPPSSWVNEEFGEVVEEFVRAGGALFCFHNALHIAQFSIKFRGVVRGAYDGHPPERNWCVQTVCNGHPLLAGVEDFVVTDEQHFPLYEGHPSALLLRGVDTCGPGFVSESGTARTCESVVAWAHEHGDGRVVVCTLGHNLDALWKPSAFQFQLNAMSWLLALDRSPASAKE